MKATVVVRAGGPEVISLVDIDPPTPGPGELLVAVEFAGVNFLDTYHRTGLYPMDYPFTLGVEGAGTVTELGNDVEGFAVGDRVAWVHTLGSYAEQNVISAEVAVPVPDGIETRRAAALMLQGMTAHYLATDSFPLAAGHRCLIHAGAGGVGLLLTQIARRKGAEIFTTVGTDEKAELSREAGSDHVIVYTRDDFQKAVESEIGPNAIDVVYDGVGAATFDKGLNLLRPRGTMVTFGNASGPVPPVSPLDLAAKGSLFLTRPKLDHHILTRGELLARASDLFDWVSRGELEVRVGAEFPLSDAADAHRALEGRTTTGKVLLRI